MTGTDISIVRCLMSLWSENGDKAGLVHLRMKSPVLRDLPVFGHRCFLLRRILRGLPAIP